MKALIRGEFKARLPFTDLIGAASGLHYRPIPIAPCDAGAVAAASQTEDDLDRGRHP